MKRFIILVSIVFLIFTGRPGSSAGPNNVILLTVDTLRADRLGCYGYEHATSPALDKLAQRGVLFTDATTNVPLTNPSFSSMMTSRYPHETGAIRNGIPMVDGIPTVAVMFKEKGYNTSAIISNWPLKSRLSNLQQGFDLYEDDFKEKRYLLFNSERDAEEVSDLAIEWLEDKPKEPFFLWVHYSDPHAPYIFHDDFDFGREESDNGKYDSEIGYTDHHIGRFIKALDKKGLLKKSFILFTSDHGESLGEHDYTGHGRRVYQPSMHVPLIVAGPGVPKGVKDDSLVQLLDVAPTMLAFAGIEPEKQMRGLDLYGPVKGTGDIPARTLYYETYPGAAPQVPGAEMMLQKPIWVGFRSGPDKVMFSVRYQRWEKYDVMKDPAEMDNLANIRDEGFISQSEKLTSWYGEWEDDTVVGEIGIMTAEDVEKFKALGYVDGP